MKNKSYNNVADSSIKALIKQNIREFYALYSNTDTNSHLYYNTLRIAEEALIEETIAYTKGIQVKAAKILGISRTTLKRKMDEFGIK